MFNFELLFLHGFSLKNRENLHRAVLTPHEYGDYFFGQKIKKKMGEKIKKTCWGCLCKSRLVSRKSSHKKNFFLEKSLFEQTPPNSETSQELRMLSTVTLDCQVTKIVMNLGSQL